jgi:hypothetical protein
MAANEIHLNNVGTEFRVTVLESGTAVNVAAATNYIKFSKPDNTVVTQSGTLYTDGTDGIITYTSASGDLDAVGTWKIQAFVDFGTNEFYSDIGSFKVYKNLS